jgi:GTP-binding protein
MGNIIAIVGRPNVGKSTLFNRLIGARQSIVDDVSGVTRDRQYGTSIWNGKEFTVVDTGGFVKKTDDIFEKEIRSQVQIAIDEATVILFMVDVTTGITDLDEEVANMLRGSKKHVYLVVNKADNQQRLLDANEFWSLGFEETYFLSAIQGSGTGELLDEVVQHIEESKNDTDGLPKIAVVGQPNVGKSSFVNALLGEDRNIVTDIAGTTRDSIHSHYKKFDKEFLMIDTAGLRRKAKVHEDLEFYSVMRAINAIEEADICILMIDVNEGMNAQDLAIFSLIVKRNKGVVILANKWDLSTKETNTMRDKEAEIKKRLSPFSDVPIIFTSVIEKQRIMNAVDVALQVWENRQRKIRTSELNELIQAAMERNPPPSHRGKFIKIKYVTQLPTYFPAFAFFCNYPKHVKESYKQYLENQLREHFDLTGVPIAIYFRDKSK